MWELIEIWRKNRKEGDADFEDPRIEVPVCGRGDYRLRGGKGVTRGGKALT